jgi:plasmid stabilization system protein ParE
MRVKFLDQAKADLVEHNQYYREIGGAALANKMLARMKAPVVALRDNPEIAQPYELAPDIRRLVVAHGAFLVFYRVRVDVEVLHIRRAERRPVSAQELERLGEDSQG